MRVSAVTEYKREEGWGGSQNLFQRVPHLSGVDISNDVPITPPLCAATRWHFHQTFALQREHDAPLNESALKRSHIRINASNANIFSCKNTGERKKKENKQNSAPNTARAQRSFSAITRVWPLINQSRIDFFPLFGCS